MNNVYFIGCTHFWHSNIIKYDNRPFASIEEMNEKMIENWNNTVKDDDDVYHAGDFAFKNAAGILERLNGKIHLIMGNHDDDRKDGAWFLKDRSDLKKNFASFSQAAFINVNKQKIYIHHYACRVWRDSHKGSYCLYSHSHGGLEATPWGRSMDVGANCIGYKPIHFDELKVIMDKRPIGEHH